MAQKGRLNAPNSVRQAFCKTFFQRDGIHTIAQTAWLWSVRKIDTIPEEAMEFIKFHDWPGNIRELQNFIERAVVLSPGTVLRPVLTELKQIAKREPQAAAERDHILEVLTQTG